MGVGSGVEGRSGGGDASSHTPSTAFRHLPAKEECRKPVLGVSRLPTENYFCPLQQAENVEKKCKPNLENAVFLLFVVVLFLCFLLLLFGIKPQRFHQAECQCAGLELHSEVSVHWLLSAR